LPPAVPGRRRTEVLAASSRPELSHFGSTTPTRARNTGSSASDRYHAAHSSPREPREREIAFHRLLRSMIDACNAVAYAHSRGVVHRDIKPHNIMLGRFGETLVVDWGIAKNLTDLAREPSDEPVAVATAEEPSLTNPGAALGTPQYMSPEQAAGETERVGPASDVYGLGGTLYCILVGHGPFPSGNVAEVLDRARRGIFPAPRRLRRSVDAALEVICLKAMALDPADRHATPLALAEAIEAWLADLRYRGEHEQTLHDAGRSMASLSIERAHHCFDRELHHAGMLWLARALESIPPDSPALDRAVRTSLGGWRAEGKLLERTLAHRGLVNGLSFSPDGRRLATASSDATARYWRVPSPIAGDIERVISWVRVATELEFDEGDAIRPIDQLDLWELRRHLQQAGGPPVK
jgi:serine/threonine protein kinase